MTQFRRFLPLAVVIAIVAMFYFQMSSGGNSKEIRSVLIGKPVPEFALPGLSEAEPGLTSADLKTGKPVIVNFFASWCLPCRAEHDSLMHLAALEGVTLVGIAYKDRPARSLAFLEELGNPFTKTAADLDGRIAIDWGVTGVPETFLVSGDGIITYRHWGPIVGDSLRDRLMPKLRELE
jgi:cytochrome c biogenesis protein CcmG/thiol:disulfide interchange protein DsbE